jgi:hypothetical protein
MLFGGASKKGTEEQLARRLPRSVEQTTTITSRVEPGFDEASIMDLHNGVKRQFRHFKRV